MEFKSGWHHSYAALIDCKNNSNKSLPYLVSWNSHYDRLQSYFESQIQWIINYFKGGKSQSCLINFKLLSSGYKCLLFLHYSFFLIRSTLPNDVKNWCPHTELSKTLCRHLLCVYSSIWTGVCCSVVGITCNIRMPASHFWRGFKATSLSPVLIWLNLLLIGLFKFLKLQKSLLLQA